MHLTLNRKFILLYLLFGLTGFACISTVTSLQMTRTAIERKASSFYQEGLYMAEQYVEEYFEEPENRITLTNLRSNLAALDIYLNAEIWLIKRDGAVIFTSNAAGASAFEENPVIENFSPTLPEKKYYTTGNFFGMFEENHLSVLIPVSHDYRVRGYIAIHTPMSVIVREKEGYLLPLYIALIILTGLMLLFFLANWFLVHRPIGKLSKASDAYASGAYDYPLSMNRDDEIGVIARSLSFMAKTLKESDEDQRKMISNISHDFRSPLTSIKGYIEAMLDGTIPPELQEKYLNTVLRETERLTKLTNELRVLNSIDPKQNRLSISDFDINMVIKNTVAAFEGICREKRIHMELLFFDAKAQVHADMGKIQQVLYNLIDNAVKFSPVDSTITIETTSHHEKIFVAVQDMGIGIPKDSLQKIWERFYKTDLSRGKDKKGTGLGLAIVKEIIQLHGENINVVSTEGVGTEFTFSLRKTSEKDKEEA